MACRIRLTLSMSTSEVVASSALLIHELGRGADLGISLAGAWLRRGGWRFLLALQLGLNIERGGACDLHNVNS